VLEDAPDDSRILDQRNDAHRPFALGAFQRIGLVDLANEPRPSGFCASRKRSRRFRARHRQRGAGIVGYNVQTAVDTLSGLNLNLAYANAEYQNLLLNLAFSNFEAILTEVTLNPTMGRYLDMVNNGKLISSIDQANENYARELLQLLFISRTHPGRTSPITIPKPLTTVLYGVFSIKTVLPAVPRKI
jgi:hypothetical protein